MHLDVQDLAQFLLPPAPLVARRSIPAEPAARALARGEGQDGFVGFSVSARPLAASLSCGCAAGEWTLMPGPQGVMPWPAGMPNTFCPDRGTLWPIETGHVDRLVVADARVRDPDRQGGSA